MLLNLANPHHTDMLDLSSKQTWLAELGLRPMPLYNRVEEAGRYVLLNGNRGNFCLDVRSGDLAADAQSVAWSSNVGHYIAVQERPNRKYVIAQRWDADSAERFDYSRVQNQLEQFHRYLENNSPATELSVVAHALRVYRSLRSSLGSDFSGTQALKAFLYLLATATEDTDRRHINLEAWQLDADSKDVALAIADGEWSGLIRDLARGRPIEHVHPNLELVLRHASGSLFQEAHYAAVFEPSDQMLLYGFARPPVTVRTETQAVGLHFTPPAIARTLVEEALQALGPSLPALIVAFDPACGSGEFLRELLRQLSDRGFSGEVRLVGWDVSPAACAMAQFIIAWEQQSKLPFTLTTSIVEQDALAAGAWPANVNLLLMNPPFVSLLDLSSEQQSAVSDILGSLVGQRPDLSTAFLWRAANSLNDGGVLGTILPASFFDAASNAHVREELSKRVVSRLVARLGSHELFPQARVDAGLYVAKKGEPMGPALAFWADHRTASASAGLRVLRRLRILPDTIVAPVDRDGYSIYPTTELGTGAGSWAPRPFRQWRLLRSVSELPLVGDQFDVKQGAITGLNRVLLLSAEEWSDLPDTEQPYFRPAILNESIRSGVLALTAYVFYPYGEWSISDEEQLRASVPVFCKHRLEPNKEALKKRARISPDAWWLLSEYRTWQLQSQPKLVSTYFGDIGSFTWDELGEAVVVQGYGWLPLLKGKLSRPKFSRRTALAYLALLNSEVFSSLLAATSNHVGGGQWNLSKRYVEKVPLPQLTGRDVEPDLIMELATMGERVRTDGLGSFSSSELPPLPI